MLFIKFFKGVVYVIFVKIFVLYNSFIFKKMENNVKRIYLFIKFDFFNYLIGKKINIFELFSFFYVFLINNIK